MAHLAKQLLLLLIFGAIANAEPIKIIYDTDIGNDVDDALALAMLHNLQTREECELLAVTISKDNEECAPFVDAVNTFYGRGDIPIGVVKGGVTPEKSKFTGLIHERESGTLVYPHDLLSSADAPEAAGLLRKTLSAQPDQSVAIVQVGFSTNLARLLDSSPDQISPLSGADLVKQKVKVLSVMAGAFQPIEGKPYREYNIVMDIPAARKLAKDWPTPIVWSGFEIGIALPYPAISIDKDFGYIDRHPIHESYQLYMPTPHERPTWDLTSVLWAVRPDRNYFSLSDEGHADVSDAGFTQFRNTPGGMHRYLILQPDQVERIREALTLLVSESPRTAPAR